MNAEYSVETTRQNLRQSVERAYADALAAKANFDAGTKAVQAAEKAFLNTKSRYEQGASTQVEYSDSRTRLDNAKVNLLNSKYEYLFRIKVLDFYQGKAISL
jgi:outer membrane protein